MSKPRNAQNSATDALRRRILSGDFRPGELLSERTVASRLNCRKAPVRVAMHRLAFEGLLEIKPQCGTVVRTLTAEQAHEILTVRALLETAVVERLAELRDRRLLVVPNRINQEMSACAAAEHSPNASSRFVDLDLQFHCALAEAAGFRETIAEFLANLRNRFRLIARPKGNGCSRRTVQEHADILKAIRAGDASGSRAALERHLSKARKRWDSRIGMGIDAD